MSAARGLLEPVFGTIVQEGVTAAIRSTVEGVAAILGRVRPTTKPSRRAS